MSTSMQTEHQSPTCRYPSQMSTSRHDNGEMELGADWDPNAIDNGLGADSWDSNGTLRSLVPFRCGESQDDDEDELEHFFTAFIDAELEGEITVCQWIASLRELSKELCEKEMCAVFQSIDHEQTGFIDAVDFVLFCRGSVDGEPSDGMSALRQRLNYVIEGHPFIMCR